jgi:toluene monooxygenase system protein D
VTSSEEARFGVGPVLQATPFARALVDAIEAENNHVTVRDEGAYLRVQAPRVCRLSRAAAETAIGSSIQFPGELEVVMSSFTGLMRLTELGAVWWLAGDPPPES